VATDVIFNSAISNTSITDPSYKHAFTITTPNFYSFVNKAVIGLVPMSNIATNYMVSIIEGNHMNATSLNNRANLRAMTIYSTATTTGTQSYVMDLFTTQIVAGASGTQRGLKPNTVYTVILEQYNTNTSGQTFINRGTGTSNMMVYNGSSWVSSSYGINFRLEGVTTEGGSVVYTSPSYSVTNVTGGYVYAHNSNSNIFTLRGFKPSDGTQYILFNSPSQSLANGDYALVCFARGISVAQFTVNNGVYSAVTTPSPNGVINGTTQYFQIFKIKSDNTPPTQPGAFSSQPATNSINLSSESISLSWGASTDTEGNAIKYTLEFFNGSSWSVLSSALTTPSYTHTLPSLGVTNAQYRVKAIDSNGGESAYRMSNVFTIRKYLLLVKDGDSLKTFKNGSWQTI
jgi:hypothetical protein